jgi:hypothetical protein
MVVGTKFAMLEFAVLVNTNILTKDVVIDVMMKTDFSDKGSKKQIDEY